MTNAAPVAIRLLGQFAMSGPDGTDLTPRSQKACALIALLCEAPELRCTRATLQDRLWSDREQAQGATSLRQALSEIRRALGDHRDILKADMRMVALDPAAIVIDIADAEVVAAGLARGLTYLDGMGVRDPEFEDWLRDRRLALEDVQPAPVPAPRIMPPVVIRTSRSTLPILHLSALSDGGPAMFAEHIVHAVGRAVAEQGAVDLRFGFEDDPGQMVYLLEAGERALGNGTTLHVRLLTMPGRGVCWQKTDILAVSEVSRAGASLSRLINQCVDSTIAAFGGQRPFGRLPLQDPAVTETAAILRRMWSSAGSDPSGLIMDLNASYERYGRGIDLAWQAFVWCFVVGERRRSPEARFDARRLIREAIELEPDNSMVLALASHVHGFVLREFEVALDFAERSVRLDRNNSLGWTFLGLARTNLGRHEEGYMAAAYARKIAGEGPHRKFIDGIAALAAFMTSRFEESVVMGEATVSQNPTFAAPLRYLIASYLLMKDNDRAQMAAIRLKQIEPDFDIRLLGEPDYPTEPLRRSGLIDLRRMPQLT